ncbi:hypothetical protein BVAVS116_H0025 (plasmid) [Borreliella valaisiana VS116]|uniref:Uncharacterized protein n=1 Tax=Borreliella valaisiana VS116 TaxID=445987 RepID=C0R982_BORVA|nr:hypothetical protein BVAVS116_H0025 [Borreliella valaisiana VS116]
MLALIIKVRGGIKVTGFITSFYLLNRNTLRRKIKMGM